MTNKLTMTEKTYGHKGLHKLYGISAGVKIEITVEQIISDINKGLGFADDEYYFLTEEERDNYLKDEICSHLNYSDTMIGMVCNDCGLIET